MSFVGYPEHLALNQGSTQGTSVISPRSSIAGSSVSPWRCRSYSYLQCQRLSPLCCPCSACLCCCCCVSSGRKEGWREHTGPVQRRGNRQEQRDLRNLACLYRCLKRNVSYDKSGLAYLYSSVTV